MKDLFQSPSFCTPENFFALIGQNCHVTLLSYEGGQAKKRISSRGNEMVAAVIQCQRRHHCCAYRHVAFWLRGGEWQVTWVSALGVREGAPLSPISPPSHPHLTFPTPISPFPTPISPFPHPHSGSPSLLTQEGGRGRDQVQVCLPTTRSHLPQRRGEFQHCVLGGRG